MAISIRIDKFLWCVRLYKTRALSNQACNKSKIKVNDGKVKASYLAKIDDIVDVKKKNNYYKNYGKRYFDKESLCKIG